MFWSLKFEGTPLVNSTTPLYMAAALNAFLHVRPTHALHTRAQTHTYSHTYTHKSERGGGEEARESVVFLDVIQ